jgi:HlyD family secretion protein
MKDATDLQQQLRSLSIPREQRPTARIRGAAAWLRWLVIGLVLAIALAVWIGRWPRSGTPRSMEGAAAAEMPVVKVSARSGSAAAIVLTATGKIVSDHRVAVATKVSGQIVALYFEQGDRIERGQVLAHVEDTIYRARRDEAAAMLEKAKADLGFQQVNFERVGRLHEAQQAPDIEYAEAKRRYEEAQAQVAASEASVAAAEKMLRDCEVVAPISGVVLERSVEVGDFVAAEGGRGAMANSQFAAIADMQKLRVEIDVSELDVARLRPDMPCIIVPDAHKDRRYTGHLLWIDPGANYAKATVQVKVRIHDPDEYLRVEGAAQVQFVNKDTSPDTAGAADVATTGPASGIWIPPTACQADSSGRTAKVFVVEEGRFRETKVTLGRREAGSIEVLTGLAEGQEIAADAQKVKNGQAARR